ncbi:hypothetical protein [Desertivirga arenae]|uniref:hypothetical protein n=1 Tax=Desertivirga arenae TaxID=2810309 RepID=UPI001A97BBD8|nr:hypothetical protein [Pedobacter sp. SYSU D00823]
MKNTLLLLAVLILASCKGNSTNAQKESNEATSGSVKIIPDSSQSRMPVKADSSMDTMPTLKDTSSRN